MIEFENHDIIIEMPPEGSDGSSVTPRGEWSASDEYHSLDLVSYQGSSYVALKTVPAGTLPTDTTYWMLSAEKGPSEWGNISGNIADQTDLANALNGKADASAVYTKTEANALLDAKADKSDTYTKTETDGLLSAKADKSEIYTQEELNGIFDGIDNALSTKADKTDLTAIKSMIAGVETAMKATRNYTAGQLIVAVNTLYRATANIASGSNLTAGTNVTATTIDAELALRAKSVDVYTKGQTDTLLSAKAPLASPALTGTPTAPTPDASDNSTRIATTAFVQAELQELESHGAKRYGVSGIGLQTAALTRLYDAVGMAAGVGTDDASTSVTNDFDAAGPFMHRKCVGNWTLGDDGHAKFNVQAYYGDPTYAEDGTKGDYVAVELPLSYYQMSGTQLVISSFKYPGYRAFDIFCRDHDHSDLIEKVYVPAYALALDTNGKAVCLPGYDNEQGDYASLFKSARKYDNDDVKDFGGLMPASLMFYYWALMNVEFATQNIQSVMKGCSALRSDGNDRVTFLDSTHILTSNYQAGRVAGERIAVIATSVSDVHSNAYKATHEVLSVLRCDENGNASASGSHQLLEVSDLGRAYYEYDTTGETEYKIGARAFPSGACNDVVSPSGSPVSNTDGYHPMRYRYRENVYGNQFHTSVDLFCIRVAEGNDQYHLDWYYLPDPTDVETPANPTDSTLPNAPYEKLGLQTPPDDYKNHYIVEKKYDEKYPDIWIPGATTGGGETKYYCDYAFLVSSSVARSARFGGTWSLGGSVGPSNLSASSAPSSGLALYGGDLCFAQ